MGKWLDADGMACCLFTIVHSIDALEGDVPSMWQCMIAIRVFGKCYGFALAYGLSDIPIFQR